MKEEHDMNIERSKWLYALIGLYALDIVSSVVFLGGTFTSIIIPSAILYGLWKKSVSARDVFAFFVIPFIFIFAIMSINQYDYMGELMMIELAVYIILISKTWSEFKPRIIPTEKQRRIVKIISTILVVILALIVLVLSMINMIPVPVT